MISSQGPNLPNLRLSLSHLFAGRDKLRTKGVGGKLGKIRLRNSPTKGMKSMVKMKGLGGLTGPKTTGLQQASNFMSHASTGSFTPQQPE